MTPPRSRSRSRSRCGLFACLLLGAVGPGAAPADGATSASLRGSAPSGVSTAQAGRQLKFETYQDKGKEYRWRLKSSNGQVIATSGQGYKDKRDCEHAIDAIKKGAEKARVEEASAE
jgi:uncharacterized protein